MASEGFNPGEMSEDELRAAYEAEIKKVRVEMVLLENVVTLINLGMRRTGRMQGTEDELDLGQVAVAIESVRAVLPIVEQIAPEQAAPIQDALSQLQLAYVQGSSGAPASPAGTEPGAGEAPGGAPGAAPTGTQTPGSAPAGPQAPGTEEIKPGEPGPAQRSGRLWVPGQ